MADQKCPMCGKLNPPELDACQFCEARLRPLIVNPSENLPSSPSKQSSETPPTENATPDWLRSLRDRQEDTEIEQDEDDLPSWPKHEQDERPGLPSGDEIEAPNWLDSLRGPTLPDEDIFMMGEQEEEDDDDEEDVWTPPELGTGEEEAVSDWLTGIRTGPDTLDQQLDDLETEADGGPEWLDRIRARQEDESPSDQSSSEPLHDLPDWLRTDDPSTSDATADWHSSIRDRTEETSEDLPQTQLPDESSEEALPDWVSGEKDDESEAVEADELPSWLKQGDDTPTGSTEELPDWMESADEPTPSADVFPDWLETGETQPRVPAAESEPLDWLAGSAPTEEPVSVESIDWTAEESELSPTDEIPDWLDGPAESAEPHAETPDEPAGILPQKEDESEEGLPDWLQTSGEESEQAQDELTGWITESEAEAAPVEAMPDWLQPDQEDSGPVEEIPDWLSDLSSADETPEIVPTELSSGELPEWLADLDQKVEAEEAEAEAAVNELGLDAEPAQELPDWLADIGPATDDMTEEPLAEMPASAIVPTGTFAEDEGELSSYLDEDAYEQEVPDWLADVKVNEELLEPEGETAAGPKDADLAPAELPSWLEAMRPVVAEATPEILDERDRQVVSAGPLAGLRGVLPAEPEISKVQKPPAYSVKLQVSDMQQERAAMLEEMVQAEGISRPIPKRPLVSSQNLLRMIFAFVLFLAILWPLVTGGPVAPIPVFTAETGAANQLIGQINSQEPVLIAVDYQPGLSGEMDAVATTLFDHLMLRGAYLTLVSTTASGPIQAEHVVAISNQQFGHSYLGAGEYTNLGYIPGGPTGLISFAADPRAMMSYALDDGRLAWENSPLQSVENLAEFAIVMVITENPETARAWIEQVQPKLGGTPLIMAISAQAEPMVRPYYEAFPKQVQGMVVGLTGSVAYESLMGHQGLAYSYWNSFSIGLLVAIVLIFIGGVLNMLPVLSKGRRENSTEREESR